MNEAPPSMSVTYIHTVYTHTGDSVCLGLGCVIQCSAGCGWADPIRREGEGEGGKGVCWLGCGLGCSLAG